MSDPLHEALALQPLLNDAVITLRAPTQVWSDRSGDLGAQPIHGVYHGDVRHVRQITLTVGGSAPEWISVSPDGASAVTFGGLLRAVDDGTPDPKVRVLRERVVTAGEVGEAYSVRSHVAHPVETALRVLLVPEFAPLMEVKAGAPEAREWSVSRPLGAGGPFTVSSGDRSFSVFAAGAELTLQDGALALEWRIRVEPGGHAEASWSLAIEDPTLVVRARRAMRPGHPPRRRAPARTRASRGGWMPRSRTSTPSAWPCPPTRTTSSTPPGRPGS